MNIRLIIEYDGTDLSGWQRQPHKPTVQEHIEAILARVTRKRVILVGSGRTDSGVHACAQVANFETDYDAPAEKWAAILNDALPASIRILESVEVPATFHAQKNAKRKTYEYRILNRSVASALERKVYFFPRRVDWDRVESCLPHFVGTKDFASFQGARPNSKTTVRTVLRFDLYRGGGGLYLLRIEGTGFLKQMVRTIVGTVLEVGVGLRRPEDIPSLFESPDRRRAGRTAPACGLYLLRVDYEE